MPNKPLLGRKLRAILKAAVVGAGLTILLILFMMAADWFFKRVGSHNAFYDLMGLVAIFLAIPMVYFCSITGYGPGLLMMFCIDVPIGALIFAIIAIFWQFSIKAHDETDPIQSERNTRGVTVEK